MSCHSPIKCFPFLVPAVTRRSHLLQFCESWMRVCCASRTWSFPPPMCLPSTGFSEANWWVCRMIAWSLFYFVFHLFFCRPLIGFTRWWSVESSQTCRGRYEHCGGCIPMASLFHLYYWIVHDYSSQSLSLLVEVAACGRFRSIPCISPNLSWTPWLLHWPRIDQVQNYWRYLSIHQISHNNNLIC